MEGEWLDVSDQVAVKAKGDHIDIVDGYEGISVKYDEIDSLIHHLRRLKNLHDANKS
jgi:hypothetical protein